MSKFSRKDTKMNWHLLKENRCPICGNELNYDLEQMMVWCLCSFKIGENKMQEIVNDLNLKDLRENDKLA